MLRPSPRTSNSFSRTARSPLIKATDDDHPLLQEIDKDGIAQSSSIAIKPLFKRAGSRNALSRSTSEIWQSTRRDTTTNKTQYPDNTPAEKTEVYIHHVTRSDTLPTIILQYQISAQVLRKANKLWTNDSIQSRAVLLLPVQACEIRPQLIDVVNEQDPQRMIAADIPPRASKTTTLAQDSESKSPDRTATTNTGSQKYKAVRQVYVDRVGLVNVALVPGANLSYFPPSKSLHSHTTGGFSSLARSSMDHHRTNDLFEAPAHDRSSFESLRIGAGQIAADAYNGTQGLIRRFKDKKPPAEINLIDF